ncbi:MAG: DUF5694 domain-containing protein, partial [Bacteroidota bacterium]
LPDLRSEQRQAEIVDLVTAIARFKPTKVILEYPYQNARLDSVYQLYLKGTHKLTINERQQVGFRLAKSLGHQHIYSADHQMNLPFDELTKHLAENGMISQFEGMVGFLQTEVLPMMQRTYDSTTIIAFMAWMNSEEMDRKNKNLYLENVNQMGVKDQYVGSDLVARWWERNFRIMKNIDNITEPGDRVLVLFGQAHTAILKDFYRSREDVDYAEILDYLKE